MFMLESEEREVSSSGGEDSSCIMLPASSASVLDGPAEAMASWSGLTGPKTSIIPFPRWGITMPPNPRGAREDRYELEREGVYLCR